MIDEPTITVSEAGFELPVVEVLTGRGVIFGKSGSGKSNSIGVVAEQLLDQGFPLCIIDTDGEHYGLKEEYEVLHVGGDDTVDVQVTPDHAEALAEIMLENDTPVILDVSGYIDESDAEELIERVISKLFSMEKLQKKPFPLIIEEIHEFVPEKSGLDTVGETIIKVAKRGRKRGLGVIGASQRPAEVKKSFVTQSSWSIWHRLSWSQDTSVVRDVAGKEYAEAVQDLDTGQAIINADWLDAVRTVQFKRKQTFDAGATPGLEEFETPELKGVSTEVLNRLESITEEREKDEEERERLEQEVEELRSTKRELESELTELRSGDVSDSAEVERLERRVESLQDERDDALETVSDLESRIESLSDELDEREQELTEFRAKLVKQDRALDSVREAFVTLGGTVNTSDSDTIEDHPRVAELEDENERLRERVEELKESGAIQLPPSDADYLEFVQHDIVQEALAEAKQESRRPGYLSDILAAIIDENGPITYEEIAERKGVSGTGNISSAATTLEAYGIVTKQKSGGSTAVDLNIDGIEEMARMQEKRQRTKEIKETYL